MAPVVNVTCRSLDATSTEAPDIGKDDLNALLYIVVTLLFYSMGIIIGIITYLKREQADMEEDQMFDLYLSLKREPFSVYKKERVRQMAVYLKEVEEAKLAREKIEAWNAERSQKARNEGDDHTPTYESSLSYPGASAEGGDDDRTRGASALLCSLTLGVCEPLLTPEGKISKATGRHIPNSLACYNPKGRIHRQRHSMPSMNNTDMIGKGILRENQRSCHEKRSAAMIPSKEGFKSIIELQDLRRFTVDREDSSSDDGSNSNVTQSREELFKRPSIPNNENVPAFKRAAFASDPSKHNKTIHSYETSPDKDSDVPLDVDSSQSPSSQGNSREQDSVEDETISPCLASKPVIKSEIAVHKSGKIHSPKSEENVFLATNEPTHCLTPSPDMGKGVLDKEHSSCEPLTLDQTLAPPTADPGGDEGKPVADSLTSIPQPDVGKLEQTPLKVHLSSPRFDSWRRGGAKSADVPDSKTLPPRRNDKRHERRGALLFAQKSLHHIENEQPKSNPLKRGVGREESTDSYSSRTTDSSDLGESPKLPPAFDKGQGSSGTPDPPSVARRQERRIPRLIRSQTVDSSKSPPL